MAYLTPACPIIWTLIVFLAAPVLTPATRHESQTVYSDPAFQFRLPPGWHKVQGTSLANFESSEKSLTLSVNHAPFEQMTPDQFLKMHEIVHGSSSPMPIISEESMILSGLPARKFVYSSKEESKSTRAWQIFVIAQHEEWHLYISGPENFLVSPEDAHYRDVQTIINSFTFSDAILSRLRASLWTPKPPAKDSRSEESGLALLLIYGGLAVATMVLVLLAFWTTRRKQANILILRPLGELFDEHGGETGGSYLGESGTLRGHYRGRAASFALKARSESGPPCFYVAVSLNSKIPCAFAVGRKGQGWGFAGLPGSQMLAHDPGLDERFDFTDLVGGGNFLTRKLLPPIPEENQRRNLKEFETWVKRPEVARALETLFYSNGVSRISPGFDPAVMGALETTTSCIVASIEGYRKRDLEPLRVKQILDGLVALAASLEA